MAYVYRTLRGAEYYLHTGPKRGGGTQYFVSTDPDGAVADAVTEGFENYETPNGQVYLRRVRPALITPDELQLVNSALKKFAGNKNKGCYLAEIAKDCIVIHEGGSGHYMPVMRFILSNPAERAFAPERFCWRGSVDDWISIGGEDRLQKLLAKYLKHLGKESFYELF